MNLAAYAFVVPLTCAWFHLGFWYVVISRGQARRGKGYDLPG
jgi:hypothetical protein